MTGKRFFRHGELPLVILALLDRRPMNTYQLLAELDRLFGDGYEPSTGTVYPAVSALRSERLVTTDAGGGVRHVNRLTHHGRTALTTRRGDLAALEVRTGVRLGDPASVDAVLDGFLSRARHLAPRVELHRLREVLDRATDELAGTKGNGGAP